MAPSGYLVTVEKFAYCKSFYLEPLYLTETKNKAQKDINRTHMELFLKTVSKNYCLKPYEAYLKTKHG